MPEVRSGDRYWPNIDTLVRDASSATYWKDRAQTLERFLLAAALTQPVKVAAIEFALADGRDYGLQVTHDIQTGDQWVRAAKRR